MKTTQSAAPKFLINANRIVRKHTAFSCYGEMVNAVEAGYLPTVSRSRAPSLLKLLSYVGLPAFEVK